MSIFSNLCIYFLTFILDFIEAFEVVFAKKDKHVSITRDPLGIKSYEHQHGHTPANVP